MTKATESIPTIRRPMHRYLFYRLQFFFYVALAFCFFIGEFCIQIWVTSPHMRMTLTSLFAVVAILLASWQVVVQYALLTRVLSPMQRMLKVIRDCAEGVDAHAHHHVSLTTIQESVQSIAELMRTYPSATDEMCQLQTAFVKLLKTLEHTWERATADTVLAAMGKTSAQVAHDMRGPLASMRVFLEYVPREGLDDDMLALREAADRSCQRLLAMADDLLEFRRATQIERKHLDVAELLKTVRAELSPQASLRRVQLRYQGPSSLSFSGDASKLTRVLHNVIQNAFQAIPEDDEGRVELRLASHDDRVIVEVEDSGTGIAGEHLDKLFVPNFTTKGKSGNGLGLAYCREVIAAHGGTITAGNAVSGGAIFRIELPLVTHH